MNLARYRKAVAAVLGGLAEAAALGLLEEPASKWVAVAVAAATAIGVYAAPNTTPEP